METMTSRARTDGDEADADLPVEAEGRDDGLNEVAEAADDALGQLRSGPDAAGGVHDGQVSEDPEGHGDGEDDGAGLAHEDAAAVNDAHDERAQGGHAVLGQLQDEGGFAGLEDGAFEQVGGGHGGDEAGQIKAEHGERLQAEESVQESATRHEGGDEQHVDGQAGGAGHEGRDQDGGDAVAAVLNGARGHDGGDGAGIGREQGDEGLAVEADGAHDAVGDEGGAGEVAGVFEDSDEEEEQENLGEENENRGDAFPDAVEDEGLEPADGQQRPREIAHAGEDFAKAVGEGLADGEDNFKDSDDDDEEEQRSPDAMEEDAVELAAGLGG